MLNMYPRALEIADETIETFPSDRWEADTPCEGWQAVHLAGHMIWAQRLLSSLARGEPWPERLPGPADLLAFATIDPREAWRQARHTALHQLTGSVLDIPVEAPVGTMPLGMLAEVFGSMEMLVHSWDLATSIGRDIELDPELTSALLKIVSEHGDALRGPDLFGPPLNPPEDGSEQDALLAFLGRKVRS
jgi:uncharacterized protein (TIGR03086 family)